MFFTSLKKNSFLRVMVCATVFACASAKYANAGYNVDTLRPKVFACMIEHNEPLLADAFNCYMKRFLDLFDSFISPKDKRMKSKHVTDFTVLLDEFDAECMQKVYAHPMLTAIKADLVVFMADLRALVKTIEDATSKVSLGATLKLNYSHLLPAKENPLDKYTTGQVVQAMGYRFK